MDMHDKPYVLIVDDIEENALLLEFILGSDNYVIKYAASVAEAIEIMGEGLPDIILNDITMPDIDGFEFMAMLKSNNRTKDIPVIVISGLDSNEDKQKAFDLGAVSFLGKPYDRFEIQNNISIILKLRRMQQELEEYNKKLNITIEQQYKRIELEQKQILFALANVAEMETDSDDRLEKLAHNASVLAQSIWFLPEYEDYISQDYLDTIKVAALLHDIGMISFKGSDGDGQSEHAERGAMILEEVYRACPNNRFLEMAIVIARYHHHDYKDSNPDVRQGEDIPLSARIMRIIDDYNRFSNERETGEVQGGRDVLQYMKEHSGIWYDPEILEVFLKVVNQMH